MTIRELDTHRLAVSLERRLEMLEDRFGALRREFDTPCNCKADIVDLRSEISALQSDLAEIFNRQEQARPYGTSEPLTAA